MSHTMLADFSDKAFKAFSNGEAVDNNGFRSKNGAFYPDQPTFRPIQKQNEGMSDIKTLLIGFGIITGSELLMNVIIPSCKKISDEVIVPFISEKFAGYKEKRRSEKELKRRKKKSVDFDTFAILQENQDSCTIINLEEYISKAQ